MYVFLTNFFTTTVVCRCSKKLPECDAATQFENALDVCLRKWRTSELKSLVTELRPLRRLTDRTVPTDMNVAIEELESRLATIRQLAIDVRIPHVLWLACCHLGQLSLPSPHVGKSSTFNLLLIHLI